MTDYRSRLLTPPREEEEIRPYRSVWRSLILENSLYGGFTALCFVVFGIFALPLPQALRQPINILIAVLPISLWIIFSLFAERLVPQPRRQLVPVFLFSVLVARAIGQPLVSEFLRVQDWLPLDSALNRIIGYTFSTGIIQVGLGYIIVRTLTWDEHLRDRHDTLAYAAAAALGYGLLPSLEFALNGNPNPYVVAANTFITITLLLVSNCIVAYGLAATRFDASPSLFMPFTVALGSFITGLGLPLYYGFLNATFSLGGASVQRHILGIGFTGALLAAGLTLIYVLFSYAERQARERELEG